MSGGKIGKGCQVRIGDGATPTESFALIAEIVDIPAIKKSKPPVDSTSHDSANKEYLYGLLNIDAITLKCIYLHAADQVAVQTAFDGGIKKNFQIQIPLATPRIATLSQCVIADFAILAPLEGVMMMEFTLQPNGLTWT